MKFSGKVGDDHEQMITSGGDPDCFPDSSLLEDTKSGIN